MATIQTPIQTRYLEPYKQKVFQYDSEYSNIYLSRYSNNILKVIGDDCILTGLEITELTRTNTNTGISFKVTLGTGIHDLTYFEFASDTSIAFDNLNIFPDTNKLLVYLSYQYLATTIDNPIKITVGLYNPTTHILADGFNPNADRIFLGVIGYTISDGTLASVTLEQTVGTINVSGTSYILRKTSDNIQQLDGGIL